jgi:hypothetical protein
VRIVGVHPSSITASDGVWIENVEFEAPAPGGHALGISDSSGIYLTDVLIDGMSHSAGLRVIGCETVLINSCEFFDAFLLSGLGAGLYLESVEGCCIGHVASCVFTRNDFGVHLVDSAAQIGEPTLSTAFLQNDGRGIRIEGTIPAGQSVVIQNCDIWDSNVGIESLATGDVSISGCSVSTGSGMLPSPPEAGIQIIDPDGTVTIEGCTVASWVMPRYASGIVIDAQVPASPLAKAYVQGCVTFSCGYGIRVEGNVEVHLSANDIQEGWALLPPNGGQAGIHVAGAIAQVTRNFVFSHFGSGIELVEPQAPTGYLTGVDSNIVSACGNMMVEPGILVVNAPAGFTVANNTAHASWLGVQLDGPNSLDFRGNMLTASRHPFFEGIATGGGVTTADYCNHWPNPLGGSLLPVSSTRSVDPGYLSPFPVGPADHTPICANGLGQLVCPQDGPIKEARCPVMISGPPSGLFAYPTLDFFATPITDCDAASFYYTVIGAIQEDPPYEYPEATIVQALDGGSAASLPPLQLALLLRLAEGGTPAMVAAAVSFRARSDPAVLAAADAAYLAFVEPFVLAQLAALDGELDGLPCGARAAPLALLRVALERYHAGDRAGAEHQLGLLVAHLRGDALVVSGCADRGYLDALAFRVIDMASQLGLDADA